MADRTGRALGSLNPVIYFEQRSTAGPTPIGYVILAPQEIGYGTELARKLFEERFKAQGYTWQEAGTLAEVDRLQKRLITQEMAFRERQAQKDERMRDLVHRETASNLRQRMISADCSPYERDFIDLWLRLQEDKRPKYTQRWKEYHDYLWAREMDAGTKVEDRLK